MIHYKRKDTIFIFLIHFTIITEHKRQNWLFPSQNDRWK